MALSDSPEGQQDFNSLEDLRNIYRRSSPEFRDIIVRGIRSRLEEKAEFDSPQEALATALLFLEGNNTDQISTLQGTTERSVRRRLELILSYRFPQPPESPSGDTLEL
jgi:hypothetical protein